MKLNKTKKLTLLAIAFAAVIQATPSNAYYSDKKIGVINNIKGEPFNLMMTAQMRYGIYSRGYYLSKDEKRDENDLSIFGTASYEGEGEGELCRSVPEYQLDESNIVEGYSFGHFFNGVKVLYIYAVEINCKTKEEYGHIIKVMPDDKGGFSINNVKMKEYKNN